MIRSWIAIVTLLVGLPVSLAGEDLPEPKPRAADVPAPPAPQLPALQMPLPDIGVPAKAAEPKPDLKPGDQPKVVAPGSLIPNSAPQPGPSIFPEANPNPSGEAQNLPREVSPIPANTPNNNVPNELKWRYKWHNGQWWYWSPDERWMIWDRNSWTIYDPATYQAPAGFAKPGPRVVVRQSTPALPENYSGAEVSTPESTYIQPTPYAFGADSYFGINGPASSYYNRGSATALTYGGSAYVPVYQGYLAPQYFSLRDTAPVYSYPGYGVPGYYGGRGVTIGFGF